MRIEFSKTAQRYIKKTKSRNPKEYKKIKKTLNLLRANPNYPSLKLHKLTGSHKDRWSVSIDRSIRLVFILQSRNTITVTDIGTHDQVYK